MSLLSGLWVSGEKDSYSCCNPLPSEMYNFLMWDRTPIPLASMILTEGSCLSALLYSRNCCMNNCASLDRTKIVIRINLLLAILYTVLETVD